MMWFKKKPKVLKPVRIAVHLDDGSTIVHYAAYRTIRNDGRLTLHNGKDGAHIIADYAPGVWRSLTSGKRSIQ